MNPRAEPRTIGMREMLAFSVGNFVTQFGSATVRGHAKPLLNIYLGVNPAALGVVAALQQASDALTDPIVGAWSDRTRTRWGRRRPFIFIGAILTGLTFALVWMMPEGASHEYYLWHYGLAAAVFYFANTLYSVPWRAMQLDLTPHYHERTRVAAYSEVFAKLAQVAGSWGFPIAFSVWFASPLIGTQWMGWAFFAFCCTFGLLPAIFARERHMMTTPPAVRKKRSLKAVFGAYKQRPFLILIIARLIDAGSHQMVNFLGTYVNVYHVWGGNVGSASIFVGMNGTVAALTGIAASPSVLWLSRRIGKMRALLLATAIGAVGSATTWWTYHPSMPWLVLITAFLNSLAASGTAIIFVSLMADVCDYDEWRNGTRREGTFAAAKEWMLKAAGTGALFVSGFVLNAVGFEASDGPAQSPETIFWMRALYAVVPAIGTLIAILIYLRYPLNAERMSEISAELKQRHAGPAASA